MIAGLVFSVSIVSTAVATGSLSPEEDDPPQNKQLDTETQLKWLKQIGYKNTDTQYKWHEIALLTTNKT